VRSGLSKFVTSLFSTRASHAFGFRCTPSPASPAAIFGPAGLYASQRRHGSSLDSRQKASHPLNSVSRPQTSRSADLFCEIRSAPTNRRAYTPLRLSASAQPLLRRPARLLARPKNHHPPHHPCYPVYSFLPPALLPSWLLFNLYLF